MVPLVTFSHPFERVTALSDLLHRSLLNDQTSPTTLNDALTLFISVMEMPMR
jgi:hypothetical protein